MTQLTATHRQKVELARRKIAQRLEIIRGRVEVDHGCNLMAQVEKAAIQLHLLNLRNCEEILSRIDGDLSRREAERAASQVANDIGEQAELLAERGVQTEKVGAGHSRDGFLWLLQKKRLSSTQEATGQTIRTLHDRATWDGLRSKAGNDNRAPDGSTYLPSEVALQARNALAAIRSHIIASTGASGPYDLIIAVCGEGATLRSIAGDDRRSIVFEGQLMTALEMAETAMRAARPNERAAA
ncbi:MAG: hypothetical protein VX755_13760 [Pseudomonadota bacterium]|nr:hypothetical protein [Pseudomonadota bacterium]MED5538651.1 hypothetical protein [Pseudomonadota bacterium]